MTEWKNIFYQTMKTKNLYQKTSDNSTNMKTFSQLFFCEEVIEYTTKYEQNKTKHKIYMKLLVSFFSQLKSWFVFYASPNLLLKANSVLLFVNQIDQSELFLLIAAVNLTRCQSQCLCGCVWNTATLRPQWCNSSIRSWKENSACSLTYSHTQFVFPSHQGKLYWFTLISWKLKYSLVELLVCAN